MEGAREDKEKPHTVYCMPYRVLRKLAMVTSWSWTTESEYGTMVYGDREVKTSVNCGIIRRGTPKFAEVKFIERRRAILAFHNHPPGSVALPSLGDVEWVYSYHERHDRYGTFEAFAIGLPEELDRGRIVFYMVTDWDKMKEVVDRTEASSREWYRYLEGKRPDVPSEVYRDQEYLWFMLRFFTRRRTVRYHPPITTPKVVISEEEEIEPYTWADVVKIVDLMKRFPEMECFEAEY